VEAGGKPRFYNNLSGGGTCTTHPTSHNDVSIDNGVGGWVGMGGRCDAVCLRRHARAMQPLRGALLTPPPPLPVIVGIQQAQMPQARRYHPDPVRLWHPLRPHHRQHLLHQLRHL
jgi:hypothetical protein